MLFNCYGKQLLLFLVLALSVFVVSAQQRAAPARKVPGKGHFAEPPSSSSIEIGREILVSEYRRAKFLEGEDTVKYCQLHSATISFLGVDKDHALLQVKASGNIASSKMEPCKSGLRVAMVLDEFNDMIRYAAAQEQNAKAEENTKRSILDILKK